MPDPSQLTSDEEPTGLAVKLPYKLDRYTLYREVGAGGMATVYLGRMQLAEGFERLVALKTIHSHLAKAQTFVDMFLDEAKIASQISHPNVCSVYDFGNVGGTYYMALEYLIGEPLDDVIDRIVECKNDDLLRTLPYLAARIIADACEGLHAAHETRGPDGQKLDVVHRDVSPQNLFVTYDGAVKVVDFGCAKAIERVTQTDTGIMKGKVAYAAPEQMKGQALDARVDVWALGVCLWETLTLKSLFRRDTAIQSAMAVLEDRIPRANEGCPWVPRRLADIAERALSRDPSKRYQTAREMGRDLRQFIARSGATFEGAELAEWMRYLFEDRQREVLRMVSEVEKSPASSSAERASSRALGDAATSLAALPARRGAEAESNERPTKAPPSRARSRPLRLEVTAENDDEPVVLPTRRRGWLWVAAVLLVLGSAYTGFRYYRGEYPFSGSSPVVASAADTATRTPQPGRTDPTQTHSVSVEEEAPDTSEESATAEPSAGTAEEGEDTAASSEAAAEGERPAGAHDGPTAASTTAHGREPDRSGSRERQATSERASAEPHAAEATAPEPEQSSDAPRPSTTTLDTSRGQVVIQTRGGWAEVYHDGQSLGRTPLRTQLPIGRQHLRLLPFGHEPAEEVIVPVEWGAINRVTLRVGSEAPSAPAESETPGAAAAAPEPEDG